MRPISEDLRKRLVKIHKEKGLTYRELSDRFSVSCSACFQIIKRYKDTGSLDPLPFNKGNQRKLGTEDEEFLINYLDSNPNFTLKELSDELFIQRQLKVHKTTIGRRLKRLNITRKKKVE